VDGSPVNVLLMDITGKTIYRQTIENGNAGDYQIKLPKKPATGQYILQVTGNGWEETKKLLIK
jgi:hypothetical protein